MNQTLTHTFQDIQFQFLSTPTAPSLISEIFSDNYKVLESKIDLRPGDVIIDLGANEGVFSIMISKLFPQTRILAFEPVPSTFDILLSNLSFNQCSNIEPYNIGIGKPGQSSITLYTNKDGSNTGGATALLTPNSAHFPVTVGLISLDDLFELYKVDRCRLLKMDVEGMEYDILYPSSMLSRTDYMTIEIHINRRLGFEARRMDALATWCGNQTKLIHVDYCKMAE